MLSSKKIIFFFVFLGPHPWHIELPKLGVKSTVAAGLNHSYGNSSSEPCICNLHHSWWQRQILTPLSKARDHTCTLTDASQICFHWATTGSPKEIILHEYIIFIAKYFKGINYVCACIHTHTHRGVSGSNWLLFYKLKFQDKWNSLMKGHQHLKKIYYLLIYYLFFKK